MKNKRIKRWIDSFKHRLQKWLGIHIFIELTRALYDSRETIKADIDRLGRKVYQAEKIIKERTDIHADVHYMSPSTIITIGRYRGRSYFQHYVMPNDNFGDVVSQLKDMQKHGIIHTIDAPPTMTHIFERELNWEKY